MMDSGKRRMAGFGLSIAALLSVCFFALASIQLGSAQPSTPSAARPVSKSVTAPPPAPLKLVYRTVRKLKRLAVKFVRGASRV
jgi:hypothetical protein